MKDDAKPTKAATKATAPSKRRVLRDGPDGECAGRLMGHELTPGVIVPAMFIKGEGLVLVETTADGSIVAKE